MPLKWNEASPCIGKRVVSMHLCAQSETLLKIARHLADRALGASAELSRTCRARARVVVSPLLCTAQHEVWSGQTWSFRDVRCLASTAILRSGACVDNACVLCFRASTARVRTDARREAEAMDANEIKGAAPRTVIVTTSARVYLRAR